MKRLSRDALITRLDTAGWRIDAVVGRDDLDWWAAEIWTLKSDWSPRDFTVFVTWLVDPQDERHVWMAVASQVPLADRLDRGIARIDARPFPDEAEAFCAALARVREAGRG
ncbi:MAG TPA: hypothetical protein VJ696_11050 [Rhodanobacteraceae bacterium]|nr:hypothetical protein [Rhodanobacteraceae bacterium]